MKNKIVLLVCLIMGSVSAMAGSLSVKVENDQVIAKVCNLKSGTKTVYFRVGEKSYVKNSIAQAVAKFENGCAVKIYDNSSNDLFLKGKVVFASYDEDGTQPMSPETVEIPKKSNGGSPTPPTNPPGVITPRPGTPNEPTQPTQPVITPRPGTPSQPAEPALKEISAEKIRNISENAANFFANRVVDIYGKVENYRYNFYRGFNDVKQLYSDLNISIQNLPEFGEGQQNGYNSGYNEGYVAGQNRGNSDGSNLGNQDARSRFERAINNPNSLDVTPQTAPDGRDFQGLNANMSVTSIEDRLNGYNQDFMNEVRRDLVLNGEIDDSLVQDIFGNYWSLRDYYGWNNYQFETVFSAWRGENAFNLFLSKRLVRENSNNPNHVKANNEMVAKYKEITDATQYKNADENARLYKRFFTDQYNEVIGRKWTNAVTAPNNYAYTRGKFYYTRALKEYAYNIGLKNGYGQIFRQRSIDGYKTTVGSAYLSSFDQQVNYFSTHSAVEVSKVDLVNQSNQKTFAIIDSVKPILMDAVNLGKQNGEASITVTGSQLNSLSLNNTVKLPIPALTRLSAAKILPAVAQIATNATPDSVISVTVSASGMNSQVLNLTISWDQTIRQFSVESANRQSALAQYTAVQLGAEWEKMKGVFKENKYAKSPATTLLGKFLLTYRSLNESQKAQINKYSKNITQVFGAKPGFFSPNKGMWTDVDKMFKTIGWSL